MFLLHYSVHPAVAIYPLTKWVKFVENTQDMTYLFEPFTPEAFKELTGLNAYENEAIYLRWVNTQVNYANYLQMQAMNASLNDMIQLLKSLSLFGFEK